MAQSLSAVERHSRCRSRPAELHLWASPDGEGAAWTSRTLVAKGGKGYASVVEAEPGVAVFVGYGTSVKGQKGLLAWRITVAREG